MRNVLAGVVLGALLGAAVVLIIKHHSVSTPNGNGPVLVPNDSGVVIGSPPPGSPKIASRGSLAAGSSLVIYCVGNNCPSANSTDSSGTQGNPKILFVWRIPYDLPEGTQMALSFRPAQVSQK